MAEIFRVFRLGLDQAYQGEFDQVGYTNFTQSMALEPGTLAMFASHVPDQASQQVVIERYASEAAYQEHVNSEHFKAFANLAQKAITSREVVTLDPKIFLEKPENLRVFGDNDLAVRLARVTVTDSQAFSEIVLPEMATSMEKEAGVLVMYAGTVVDQPNTWYFIELYQDQAAYDSHIQTPHFKTYIEGSQPLLVHKTLQVLTADMLVNRGSRL